VVSGFRLRRRRGTGWGPGSLILAALALAGCGRAEQFPQTVFDPAGPVARIQLDLLMRTLYLVIGIFILVAGVLLYVVFRYRERPGAGDPEQIHGNTQLEMAWTIAPIVALAFIAVPTVRANFAVAEPPPESDPLVVRAVGHQWWFEFQYPDLGVITANELHIPVGRPVKLLLDSEDVIHSFWVPRLAGKTDMIPGYQNTMWIQADEPGTYYGQCAELCGASHAKMRFRVIAVSEEEFQAWVERMQTYTVDVSSSALAARGMELFREKGCFACHAIAGTEFQNRVGPDLTGVGSRTTIAAGTLANTRENLSRWLADPPAIKPGSKMPNLGLKPDEIEALVEFLHSLK